MVFGRGSKLRFGRVASDSCTVIKIDEKSFNLSQRCWANMPHELLREILIRLEVSETTWPSRRNVVACAGVCRSWRDIVREIVKRPEVSGKLTFPVSLKQPGPRYSLIQCFIKRDRSTQTFHLYINSTPDDGKFLLAACRFRRPTWTDYFISLHRSDFSMGYIGKLRGPRKMQCIMDAIPASAVETGGMAPTQTDFPLCKYNPFPSLPFSHSKPGRMPSAKQGRGALVMRNKSPRWHEQLQRWCLNFHGRVTVASVKNFQLVAAPCDELATPERENVILQFGKVGKDVFTMDYAYPLSAFQAFAICLSSFDTKISHAER